MHSEASGGAPPCRRCTKEGRECVLGSSNRGGHRIRRSNIEADERISSLDASALKKNQEPNNLLSRTSPITTSSLSQSIFRNAAVQNDAIERDHDDDSTSTANSTNDAPPVPLNPSDAFQLLKDVANQEADQSQSSGNLYHQANFHSPQSGHHDEAKGLEKGIHGGIMSYRLVSEGVLNPSNILMLVGRYVQHYHPYLPLVPRKYFQPEELGAFAVNNKHLLTAVLTISSRDLIDQPYLHLCCSRYMDELISKIAAGHGCEVEAVEALLLLAEWEPQGLRDHVEAVGHGEEDRSAWMHVGTALRTAYFIGLDRTSFRQESIDKSRTDSRKRLAWMNCYVSDRLISVRIGRAFWSRGPGPMTGLSDQDFPSLQPFQDGEEDYAKIFQAVLDLTQLYSNVQDVLYTGMLTSKQMMLMGDYVRYVDEFRQAIARWNLRWGTLQCSRHINATLQMSYEYLCLYTNAFVFQATITQALATRPIGDSRSLRDHLRHAFSNVGAMPDARFIWASIAAAKGYLTLVSTALDPVQHLRYVPLRYYLYAVYSAVFLFKARSYEVIDYEEEQQVRQLVHETIDVLRKASVSSKDPGSRYARLLELLWINVPKIRAPMHPPSLSIYADSDPPFSSTGLLSQGTGGYMQHSQAADFSWLDLEAAGHFVSGDQITAGGLHAPMPNFQPMSFSGPEQTSFQWNQPANMVNNSFFDMDGSLLF